MTIHGFGHHAHLAGVRKLDGIANKVKQNLRQSLLIAEGDR